MNNKNSSGGGLGISGVLLIVFIVLKLVGVINWSWWWVLSPLWIPLLIFVVAVIILTLCYYYQYKHDYTSPKKRNRDKWKF